MLRISVIQIGYETNTFALGVAGIQQMGQWTPAEQVFKTFNGTRSAVGGAIDAIMAAGHQLAPVDLLSRGGAFNAGPILAAGTLENAMDRICDQLSQVMPDGLFFAMHGATCQQGIDDGDGYCLKRLRQVLGDRPIMCSMDLHGNITQEMCDLADGIFGIKEHPHTDYYEAGALAAQTLIRTLEGQCNPKMALVKIPMLVNSASGNTISGIGRDVRNHLYDSIRDMGLIDATYFHGFSATDSAITSASALAVADGFDPTPQAEALSQWLWERKEQFNMAVYNASDAIDTALSLLKDGYVVINEGADNPGGGSPGDGTHLLREMVKRQLPGSIMGPLFDPESAAICHTHTPGDRFTLSIGGKTDPVFGAPLETKVELITLCQGDFVCAGPIHQGVAMSYGPTARIRIGNVECILVSQRFQTYDDRPFLMTGADLKDYQIVALKSMNHFRGFFTPRADAIVVADTPSVYPSDLSALDYKYISRPIYPLDRI